MKATSLTIEELSSNKNEEGLRSITLIGRALPYKPFELSGTQRAEITYYQGNPVGSAQVIGPAEQPTRLTGMWKDKYIGTPEAIALIIDAVSERQAADTMALVKAVDEIRLRGRLLKVTWDTITREGILTNFTQRWLQRQDCEWEMEFSWTSQGQQQGALGTAEQSADESTRSWITSAMDAVYGALSYVTDNVALAQDYRDSIQAKITQVATAASSVIDVASEAADYMQGVPDSTKQNLVASCQSVQNHGQALIDTLSNEPPRRQAQARVLGAFHNDLDTVDQATATLTAYSLKLLELATKAMVRGSKQQAQAILRQLDPTLKTVVYAQDGQDLRAISIMVYGTANQAQALKAFNRFGTTSIPKGTMVLCPMISRGGSA